VPPLAEGRPASVVIRTGDFFDHPLARDASGADGSPGLLATRPSGSPVQPDLVKTTPSTVRVLLIVDNQPEADRVDSYLGASEHPRFELFVAWSVTGGLTALAEMPPDCILLDLSLPGAGNTEAVVALRDRAPTVPIVVLAARGDDDEWEASLRAGAQDFIAWTDLKPSILRRMIRHAITRQRQQRLLGAAYDELALEAGVRQRTEDSLQLVAAELERSNAEFSQFAYVAAHDLRSPLGTVAGFAQLLADLPGVVEDPDAVEIAGHIEKGVERMQDLIDDLLAYCSIGSNPPKAALVDLHDLAVDAREALLREAPEGTSIEIGELPTVEGDEGQLGQLLDNVMSNALKFVPAGRIPRSSVTAEASGGGWQVTVADNGIGIVADERTRVFGMFQRLHGEASYPGTGIGLAISARVVDRHHGRIWVEDNEPVGTRLCVWLPAAA
jgi:signal transduction histidine kinase